MSCLQRCLKKKEKKKLISRWSRNRSGAVEWVVTSAVRDGELLLVSRTQLSATVGEAADTRPLRQMHVSFTAGGALLFF